MKKTLTAEYFIERVSKKVGNYISYVDKNNDYNFEYDLSKDYLRFKGNARINTDMKDYGYLNNLEADCKYILSFKDEYMDLGLNIKQNNASIPLNIYFTSLYAYLDSKDLNINLIGIPLEENPFTDYKKDNLEISNENVIYAFDKLSNILLESLKEALVETSNQGLIYKYKYTVDNKNNDSPFIKKFIESIKNDNKLREILLLEEDFDQQYFESEEYLSYFTLEIVHNL